MTWYRSRGMERKTPRIRALLKRVMKP